jgi:GNAT superfamily N-acetyltransferase
MLLAIAPPGAPITVPAQDHDYFLKSGDYGFRLYEHDRDEEAVCRLCWSNALPGGRPFALIPEPGALSFGRIVTGPFARYAPTEFFVADDLTTGKLVGYLTGADGGAVETGGDQIPWLRWRDRTAHRIAECEFGEISPRLLLPGHPLMECTKLLYTVSLGPRAIQFLLHEMLNAEREMPRLPACPEFHFQVAREHRGNGIGNRLLGHFLRRLIADNHRQIGAQVTVCEGQVSLEYYERMRVRGKRLWSIYDRRETTLYTDQEKRDWELGHLVENLSLVAETDRLLEFVERSD